MNDVSPTNTVWTPDGETPVEASGLPSEDALIEAIATVYDPEIPVNIYELGLIYAVEIDDDGAREGGDDLDRAGLPERAGTAGAGAEGGAGGPGRHRPAMSKPSGIRPGIPPA